MKRRQFLAVSATGFIGAIAGCSDTDDPSPTETPTDTNNTTNTPTDTDDDTTQTPVENAPEDLVGISQFAFNQHEKNAMNRPYTLTLNTVADQSSQTIEFVYNGSDKSFFTVESTRDGATTTVERYSSYGVQYTRTNPPEEDIQYQKRSIEGDSEAFVYTGVDMIDELTNANAEVSSPKPQDSEGVFRYEFVNHPDYDSVSGYIELDITRGVITQVMFEGKKSASSYSLEMDFTFGGQTVTKPSWVEDSGS